MTTRTDLKTAGDAISATLPDNASLSATEQELRAYSAAATEAAYAEPGLADLVNQTNRLVTTMTENNREIAAWRDLVSHVDPAPAPEEPEIPPDDPEGGAS